MAEVDRSRRKFLKTSGTTAAAGVISAYLPAHASAELGSESEVSASSIEGAVPITLRINGKRVLSCLNLALMHDGNEITTIEGLGTPDALHPMQKAFLDCDGYQCGYCTSGQIMSAVALLKEPCGPEDAAVKELMSGNICRCGAYANIVQAIQQVRKSA